MTEGWPVAGSTQYPGALDNYTEHANTDTIEADHVNDLQAAVEAVEAELGVNPSGSSATVVARLDAADAVVAGKADASAVTSALAGKLAVSSNLSDVASPSSARSNLGLGTAATQASSAFLQTASNLSDVANAATARSNLGVATFSNRGVWASSTAYALGDVVKRGAFQYQCVTAHTSAYPFDTTKWLKSGSLTPHPPFISNNLANFGHSIAVPGATNAIQGWVGVLGNTYLRAGQFNTFAVSGRYAAEVCSDIATNFSGPGSGQLGLISWMGLANDMSNTPSAQQLTGLRHALRAFLYWARSWGAGGSFIDDGSGSCAYTGTWGTTVDTAGSRSTTTHSTTTQNDFVTITLTPGAAGKAIVMLKGFDDTSFGTAGAAYSIKQGATVLATGTTSNQMTATGSGKKSVHIAVPISGLGSGSTTITVTKTDATGSVLVLDGVIIPPATSPTVLVMKDLGGTGIGSTAQAQYWSMVDSVVAEFGVSATEIVVVNPASYITGGTWGTTERNAYTTDGLHPNSRGVDLFVQAAVEALTACDFRAGQNSGT